MSCAKFKVRAGFKRHIEDTTFGYNYITMLFLIF